MSSSWVNELHNPHHTKRKLLYLSAFAKDSAVIDILDYKTGTLIGQVYQGFYGGTNLCSDRNGNVYAASWESGAFEIQAGTTKVIRTFATRGNAVSCAVSPSGDVAFTIVDEHEGCRSGVDVFRASDGTGRRDTFYPGPEECDEPAAYDDKGNLFVFSSASVLDGNLYELPARGSIWVPLRSNHSIGSTGLEWDGKYLASLELYQVCHATETPSRSCIDRIAVSGHAYKVVKRVHLLDSGCRVELTAGWAENAKNPNGQTTSPATEIVAAPGCDPVPLAVWAYPAGGEPKGTISLRHIRPEGAATIVTI